MKRRLSFFLAAVVAAPGMASAATTASLPPGAELASACTACHGVEGHSRGAVPSLAGMKPARFHARMQAFQQGEGTIMDRIAPAYSKADIAALADYFASQSKDPSNAR